MVFLQNQLKKYSFIFLVFLLRMPAVCAQQELDYTDRVFSSDIKTVQLYPKNEARGYPIIRLKSNDKLVLEFDDLSAESKNYNYVFIHCTPDWQPTDLMYTEYTEGFSDGQITDYKYSFNTLKNYLHYRLEFPEDDYKPLLSGNYLLLVYQDYDRNRPVLSMRFRVLDEKTRISAEIKRSEIVNQADCCTQFRVSVQDVSAGITDDLSSTALYIHRNDSEVFALRDLLPDFVKGNLLEYNNPRKLYLPGGNEYRYTNLKNRKRRTDRVAEISFNRPYYIYTLYPDIHKPHIYSNTKDINGKFVVTSDHTEYPDTEAEYVLADFYLKTDQIFADRELYLYGAFSNYKLLPENRLEYDERHGMYSVRIMLKQGFYNYCYALYDPDEQKLSLSDTEGNFYQTENDYNFYFYYRAPGEVHYQLIGSHVQNSQKRY